MVHIYFQNDTEACKWLQFVSVHPLGAELHSYIQFVSEEGIIITVEERHLDDVHRLLSDVFYTFLVEEKVRDGLEHTIREKFLFEEQDEVDAILDIAASIVEGEMKVGSSAGFKEAKAAIAESIQDVLTEAKSFSFESIATFRLKGFFESLEHYAGLAIDEYKLEQDYQNFIATLRDFLNKRQSQLQTVHLVHQENFAFFDESYQRLEKDDFTRMMDRRLLGGYPIYIDSTALAPLISIAPERLYVYTDDAEDGLIQTIRRVFEERTIIRPVQSFSSTLS
ncbi:MULTISPECIES: putative sporulation protein YtxC [Bacillaceae]|uniref:Sporulation protein YtxC n=1 Tax=Peribacillus huizhouensis TaxID=1501239 RepID=A0ABR6CME3_9BACI|nr:MULTISPECIES: putative sporulation protein YtxC [Bacillaceae]MBA9025843.1 putative sporulation protein YtxC [Peribacillus huizhouensis]